MLKYAGNDLHKINDSAIGGYGALIEPRECRVALSKPDLLGCIIVSVEKDALRPDVEMAGLCGLPRRSG